MSVQCARWRGDGGGGDNLARSRDVADRAFLRTAEGDAVIADCQEWIAENYAVESPVQAMAERSGLNPRTFTRRFKASTGYQPIEYVQALRVEEAKQMLETSEQGVDEIAALVGYEDTTSFRRLFKRKAGLTPAAYRRKFRGILPVAAE